MLLLWEHHFRLLGLSITRPPFFLADGQLCLQCNKLLTRVHNIICLPLYKYYELLVLCIYVAELSSFNTVRKQYLCLVFLIYASIFTRARSRSRDVIIILVMYVIVWLVKTKKGGR